MIIHSTTLNTMEKVIAEYGGITWVRIDDRFLLGAGSSYAVNSTGGEASHILTTAEMPLHNHALTMNWGVNWISSENGGSWTANSNKAVDNVEYTTGTGGNQPHNNMPPYKAVYIWERTE